MGQYASAVPADAILPRPVFVVGALDACTEPLATALGAHPDVAVARAPFLAPFLRRFEPDRVLAGDELPAALGMLAAAGASQPTDLGASRTAADLAARAVRAAIGDAAAGAVRWVDPTAANLSCVRELVRCFPDASVVAVVRDPRAVLGSVGPADRVGTTARDVGRHVARAAELVRRSRNRFPPERFTVVRDEDLAADPVPALEHLCRFLDLAYDTRMASALERARQRPSNGSGAFARAQVEAISREVMTEYGYARHAPAMLDVPLRATAALAHATRHPVVSLKSLARVGRAKFGRDEAPRTTVPNVAVAASSPTASFEAQLADDRRGFVCDVADPARPTVVAFGGIGGGVGLPHYEFFRLLGDVAVNRVFVRDLDQCFYHRGVRGLGATFDDVAENLAALLPPSSRTVFVGSSAGGYAAIILGTLAQADHVLTVAPITFIDRWHRLAVLDRRWASSIDPVNRGANVQRPYLDARRVLASAPACPPIDCYYPSRHRLDALHSRRLGGLPTVRLLPVDSVRHELVKEMRDAGTLREVVLDALGEPHVERRSFGGANV
jgi:hypothetical protein